MKAARFIVETHAHLTTLYKPNLKSPKTKELVDKGLWTGLNGELETFDNSSFALFDMETYGVNMCILLPSIIGTTNEMQAMLVDKYPDKFRAMCSDQKQKLKMWRENLEWSLEVAVEEVEASLKTGKFVGIGEFVPGGTGLYPPRTYTFRQRLDEWRRFMDLGAKYGVAVDFHEWRGEPWGGGAFAGYGILTKMAAEYPNVHIINCHGGQAIGSYKWGPECIQRACAATGGGLRAGKNVYLETGTWPAEYFEIALKDPNVGATQLVWGGDYGNVPQYITAHLGQKYHPSSYTTSVGNWPFVPSYQTDFWGWSLHQIHKIKDLVTQDEINLILGGNAAKIFKLPVPHPRMFPEGRPDLWGIHWQKSIPFLPAEQIQNPD